MDVMKKALQLAKHLQGMPEKQAYCDHEWEPLFAEPVTLVVTERRCIKCDLHQRSVTVWRDVFKETKCPLP